MSRTGAPLLTVMYGGNRYVNREEPSSPQELISPVRVSTTSIDRLNVERHIPITSSHCNPGATEFFSDPHSEFVGFIRGAFCSEDYGIVASLCHHIILSFPAFVCPRLACDHVAVTVAGSGDRGPVEVSCQPSRILLLRANT